MQQYYAVVGEKTRYQLEAYAILCGNDISVIVCGGCKYHVGAVAFGQSIFSEDEKKHSTCVSSFCALGHRDDEVARLMAKRLAARFNCRTSVSVGIHVDDASSDDISFLMHQSEELCEQLSAIISKDR